MLDFKSWCKEKDGDHILEMNIPKHECNPLFAKDPITGADLVCTMSGFAILGNNPEKSTQVLQITNNNFDGFNCLDEMKALY